MNTRKAPPQLVSEMQMLRIRVAAAESKLKVMREQARETKRRRKEAKRIAQSARKRFKQSKADVSELREALAAVEARLFRAGGRALARQATRNARTRARTLKATKPAKPQRTVAKRSRRTKTSKRLGPGCTANKSQAPSSLPMIPTAETVTNATNEPL